MRGAGKASIRHLRGLLPCVSASTSAETKIEAIAVSPAGAEIARRRVPTPRDYAASLDAIADLVGELERAAGAAGSVASSQSEIRIERKPAGAGEEESDRDGEKQELELPPPALGTRGERGPADPHGREGHSHVRSDERRAGAERLWGRPAASRSVAQPH